MTHIDTGIQGAKRQSWKHANPRDTLKTIIEDNPRSDKESLLETFKQAALSKGNRDLLETIIEYWFANNFHSLLNADSNLAREFNSPSKEKIKHQIRERIKIAAGVILMDMIMPNNKPLKDCTGRECAAVGGWLSVVAARMPASGIIGKIFTEEDLRAFLEQQAKGT